MVDIHISILWHKVAVHVDYYNLGVFMSGMVIYENTKIVGNVIT